MRQYAYLLAIAAVLLNGCAAFGISQPKTFEERLAYGYASHTATLQATTSSLNAHVISSGEAEDIMKQADTARAGLDAAKLAFGGGDLTTAEGRLSVALTVLTELQTYLHNKSKPT